MLEMTLKLPETLTRLPEPERDMYLGGQLRKYASYPHHLHQQDGVHPSQVRSLSAVFERIAKLFQD